MPRQIKLTEAKPWLGMAAPEWVARWALYLGALCRPLCPPAFLVGARIVRFQKDWISIICTRRIGACSANNPISSFVMLFLQEVVDVGVGLRYP